MRRIRVLHCCEYGSLLKETIDLLKRAGVPLFIVVFPEFMQLPTHGYPDTVQRFVAQIATATKTPYLDLLPILRQNGTIETLYLLSYDPTRPRDEQDPFFPERPQYVGNGHMSRYGYFVAAQAIADVVLNEGLLPGDSRRQATDK